MLQTNLDGEDHDGNHQYHLDQQLAELADTAFKTSFWGLVLQSLGNLAEFRVAASRGHHGGAEAADHVRAEM